MRQLLTPFAPIWKNRHQAPKSAAIVTLDILHTQTRLPEVRSKLYYY